MSFDIHNKPILINQQINTMPEAIVSKSNSTISDKIAGSLSDLYNDYFKDYKAVIIICSAIIIFLVYRYYNKKERQEEEFNPLYSVNEQREEVYYPPDPLPVNLPNKGIVFTRKMYEEPNEYTGINTLDYDYTNVYKNPNSYYSGTFNTYNDAKDTKIINPFGYSNNFNTNSGKFVSDMTRNNKNNITEYQTVLDNTHGNLINALKIGPSHLNSNIPEYNMDPPYSDEYY
jgi:hypothetical protein